MNDPILQTTIKRLIAAAQKVQRCPACQSTRIRTVLNVAYQYDHQTQTVGVEDPTNLAKHGWHTCSRCQHRWVSNGMLQTALTEEPTKPREGTVIDLAKHKSKSE